MINPTRERPLAGEHSSPGPRCLEQFRTYSVHLVLGYYSISVGSIDRKNLPAHAAKRFPSFPIPVARLARLAMDREFQGRGLGEHLLLDALNRVLRASSDIGVVAILLDAKHEKAKHFYARYEFESLPDQPLTLWLPMAAAAKLFPEA